MCRKLLVMLLLGQAAVMSPAFCELNPSQMAQDRIDAEQLLGHGQMEEAATLLLTELRSLPNDKLELIDYAVGNSQLLMFTVEYLMDNTMWQSFRANFMHPDEQPMDALVANVFDVLNDVPLSVLEMTKIALNFESFGRSEHPFVRVSALCFMASPYYFYDTPVAAEARRRLAEEYGTSSSNATATAVAVSGHDATASTMEVSGATSYPKWAGNHRWTPA